MFVQPSRKRAKRTDERNSQPKYYMSWRVSNDCYETVATFAYADKSEAVSLAEQLQKQGNGKHFVRAIRDTPAPSRRLLTPATPEPEPTPIQEPPEPIVALTKLVRELLQEVAGLRQQVAQLSEDQEYALEDLYQLLAADENSPDET